MADGRGVMLASPRGRWLLAVTVLGSALALLQATVVNVALPAIGAELGAGVSGLQWVLNGYLLTLASLILLGGSLGDRLGRRRVYVIGVGVFTVMSAACAAAPTVETLIAARIAQGVGAAMLTPGSLAMLESLLRPQDRGKAIGAWSALTAIAAAVGPLLGGWLVTFSWRWVFVLPVPLGVLVAVAAQLRVPESRNPDPTGSVDVAGAVLAATALAGLTFALVQARTTPAAAAVAAVVGAVSAAGFVVVERRRREPMLPLDVFSSRQFSAANALTFVVYAALGGVFFLLVVFLQTALGYSALQAGAASLPITALMLVLSSAAGSLAHRIGPRLPLTVGPLLIAAGMLLMLRIEPGSSYLTDVLPAVVVFGLGLSATVAPVTATVLAAVDDRRSGIASGVNNAVARTAQLAAVAALPLAVGLSQQEYTDPAAFTGAFHRAMVVTAGLAVLGAVIGWFGIRSDVLDAEGPARPHVSCGVAEPPQRESAGTRRRL